MMPTDITLVSWYQWLHVLRDVCTVTLVISRRVASVRHIKFNNCMLISETYVRCITTLINLIKRASEDK